MLAVNVALQCWMLNHNSEYLFKKSFIISVPAFNTMSTGGKAKIQKHANGVGQETSNTSGLGMKSPLKENSDTLGWLSSPNFFLPQFSGACLMASADKKNYLHLND